ASIDEYTSAWDKAYDSEVAGKHIRFDIDEESAREWWINWNYNKTDNPNMQAVVDALNDLEEGKYAITFSFDYASTLGKGRRNKFELHTQIRGKGEDKEEYYVAGKDRIGRTAYEGNQFGRFYLTKFFTVGNDAENGECVPGTFTGLKFGVHIDSRQNDSDSNFVAVDNFTIHKPQRIDTLDNSWAASYKEEDEILWRDYHEGDVLASASVPSPGEICMCNDSKDVYAISEGRVVRVSPTEQITEIIAASELENPRFLDYDADLDILLVAEGDPSHQVKKFNAENGSLMATYGRDGGREYGAYVPENLRNITDVVSDEQGGFLVTERNGGSPRTAHIDEDGALVKQWFGGQGFFNQAHLDPGDESVVFFLSSGAKTVAVVNPEDGSFEIVEEYKQTNFDGLFAGSGGATVHWEVKRRNGHTYLVYDGGIHPYGGTGGNPGILRVDEEAGKLVPVATCGWADRDNPHWRQAMEEAGKDPDKDDAQFAWSDVNGNGEFDTSEFVLGADFSYIGKGELWGEIDEDFNLYLAHPDSVLPNPFLKIENENNASEDVPIWDLNKPVVMEKLAMPEQFSDFGSIGISDIFRNSEEDMYALFHGNSSPDDDRHGEAWPGGGYGNNRIIKWDKNGNRLWSVGRHALNKPQYNSQPTPPAYFHEFTKIFCEKDGNILVGDRAGDKAVQVWTDDGLYAGSVLDNIDYGTLPSGFSPYLENGDDRYSQSVSRTDTGDIYWMAKGPNFTYMFEVNGWESWHRDSGTITIDSPMKGAAEEGTGLAAEYYNNNDFSGDPVLERVDERLYFDEKGGKGKKYAPHRGSGLPWEAEGVDMDSFCVRWSGSVEAPLTEDFIFSIYAENGDVKVWFNDSLIINASELGDGHTKFSIFHPPQDVASPITLEAGVAYPIVIEYNHNKEGNPLFSLNWESYNIDRRRIYTENLYPEKVDPVPEAENMRRQTN
ncbi:MAG: PA14 domain-containing protein, partial [Planctomycetota bacterium]